MALEIATYITELNTANPDGADIRTSADDHLRLIKRVIKQSFSGVAGAINVSQGEINKIVGVTSNVQTQLDTYLSATSVVTSNAAIAPGSWAGYSGGTDKDARYHVSPSDATTLVIYGAAAPTFGATVTALMSYKYFATSSYGYSIYVYNYYATTKTISLVIKGWD